MKWILTLILIWGTAFAQEPAPRGKRLHVLVEVAPIQFSWSDLSLTSAREFSTPLQTAWVKWWGEPLPEGFIEVIACNDVCETVVNKWREGESLPPEFAGDALLTININLKRSQVEGLEPSMSWEGGILWHDFDTRQRLRWGEFPNESHVIKGIDAKAFNTQLASLCYRSPLGKFLELKNQTSTSISPKKQLVARFLGAAHMGQVIRLMAYFRTVLAPMDAEVKLQSFGKEGARILIFFRGDEEKLQSLVSGPRELESEWGRPLTVESLAGEVIYSFPVVVEKAKEAL